MRRAVPDRAVAVRIVAPAVLFVTALLLVEASLQVASRVSRRVERALAAPWEMMPVVPDERLIHRGNALMHDHDEAGYRNERRLTRADIVTLGDSMTYGPVDPRHAWPRILGGMARQSVYNMALPGYGPAQSLFQLDAGLALKPRVLIVAPYFGNDLFDSFLMARRHPDLLTALPPELVQRAHEVEARRKLLDDVASPFTVGIDGTEQQVSGARRWMSETVMLFKLARSIRHHAMATRAPDPLLSRDFSVAAAGVTPGLRHSLSPFEGSGRRTILSGRYRLRALDDSDPRIRVGFLVMGSALERLAEQAQTRAPGTRVLVVLFPTKESVFWPLVPDVDRHPGLRELVANEDRLRAELLRRLTGRGIETVDLLDVLRAAPEQPYYEDVDSHPNPAGYRVVAATIASRLAER
jgi:GDSL-like Lipase/Acylhydrolase family